MKISYVFLLVSALLLAGSLYNGYIQHSYFTLLVRNNNGSVNVLDYGAVGDGVADDSKAFIKAFDAAVKYGNDVYIPRRTYLINQTLAIASGMVIHSAGATLTHTNAKIDILSAMKADDWSLEGPLTLSGTNTSKTPGGTENGITISGCNRYMLDKITLRNFAGAGIDIEGGKPSHAARGDSGKFSFISFIDNNVGLKLHEEGKYSPEYNLFSLLSFSGNGIAVDIGTGNNIIATSNIVDNSGGAQLTISKNGGHGIFSGVNINHNKDFNVKADSIPQGYSFVGTHIYGDSADGGIDIKNSKDFYFVGGTIDASLNGNTKQLLCADQLVGTNMLRKNDMPGECKK